MAPPSGVRLIRATLKAYFAGFSQLTTAGEIGPPGDNNRRNGMSGAEGATAPETLRHPNRSRMGLWKVAVFSHWAKDGSPKM